MSYFDQGQFDQRCEWGAGGIERVATSDVIVIVDVLSFTTSVDVAVGRGATVLPYRWDDEESAARYAREQGADLAVPRGHGCDEGGGGGAGYSLAPSSLCHAPRGLRLVLPSPNGSSLAFAATARGAVVLAGCLRNATAVAAWAAGCGERITVVPAGERWPDGTLRPAVEDLIGAGAILSALPGRSSSPEARLAVAAFWAFAADLRGTLLSCASGRELVERGFGRDVELAAEFDGSAAVPVLKDGAFAAADALVGSPIEKPGVDA